MNANASVLAGGLVCDGTGQPAIAADVYVREGKIDGVRPSTDSHGKWCVRDFTGCVVAPGFIDVHSHGDNAPLGNDDTWKIEQGITTEVVGNCGFSLGPGKASPILFPGLPVLGPRFRDVLAETDRRGYVTNYAPLVGHGNLRRFAMENIGGKPSAAEIARMINLLDEALEAGAFGMSTGLVYPPGVFSDTDELVTLASKLWPQHIFASHMRNETDMVAGSVAEIIEIGERSNRRVHVSHHKIASRPNWGASKRTLQLLAEARARGVRVTQDAYPYTASSTFLSAQLPAEYHKNGPEELLRRLQNPDAVEALRADLTPERSDWENLLVVSTGDHRFEGRTLAELAKEFSPPDPVRALVHILVEEKLDAFMVMFWLDEADVERILRDPHTSIGTDGMPPGMGGKPHPRTFGTFPRFLGEYVRRRGITTMEEAIRRMTSLAADTFGIPERGRIVAGAAADLVVFDPQNVADDMDYLDPIRRPKGIRTVMQGGNVVVDDGRFVGGRFGHRLLPSGVKVTPA